MKGVFGETLEVFHFTRILLPPLISIYFALYVNANKLAYRFNSSRGNDSSLIGYLPPNNSQEKQSMLSTTWQMIGLSFNE